MCHQIWCVFNQTAVNVNRLVWMNFRRQRDSSGTATILGRRIGLKPVDSLHFLWYIPHPFAQRIKIQPLWSLKQPKTTSTLVWYDQIDEMKGEIYVAFNTSHLPVTVSLPIRPGYRWEPLVDTSKFSPYDFLSDDLPDRAIAIKQYAHFLDSNIYPMLRYSSVVLLLRPEAWPWFNIDIVVVHEGWNHRPCTYSLAFLVDKRLHGCLETTN